MSINGTGTFGRKESDTWKPWKYSHRVKVAKEVEKYKKIVELKNVKESTKRSNVTTFIAKQRSRQEFIPLVAEKNDRAHVKPPHLKDNACALAHRYLLCVDISISKLNIHLFLLFQRFLLILVSINMSKPYKENASLLDWQRK
jgi:hypothetical protein